MSGSRAAHGAEPGAVGPGHGVDGRSLNLWRVNLQRRGQPHAAVPLLVELVPARAERQPARPYVLRVASVELELDASFDEATLRRLVSVLKSC